MNMKKPLYLAAFAAIFTLSACGDDSSSSASAEPFVEEDPEIVSSASEDDVDSSSSKETVVSSESVEESSDSEDVTDSSSSLEEESSSSVVIESSEDESSSSAAKCGEETFDPEIQFCLEESLFDLCGGESYEPATQYCKDDVVTDKSKCVESDELYIPETQYCMNATTVTEYGSLADSRDNQTYKTVIIGTQTWMAENLNYEMADSYCYGEEASNCDMYGRLYSWTAATEACPAGSHLPSVDEWNVLLEYAGGYEVAGIKLKSVNDWVAENYREGEDSTRVDAYGFSVLGGGSGYNNGDGFVSVGVSGKASLWTSTVVFEGAQAQSEKVFAEESSVGYSGCNPSYSSCATQYNSIRCIMD